MTHMSDDEFCVAVEAFLDRTGIAPSRFGEMSCGDRNLMSDLRAGEREFKKSTVEKVMKWISGFEAGLAFGSGAAASSDVAADRTTPQLL